MHRLAAICFDEPAHFQPSPALQRQDGQSVKIRDRHFQCSARQLYLGWHGTRSVGLWRDSKGKLSLIRAGGSCVRGGTPPGSQSHCRRGRKKRISQTLWLPIFVSIAVRLDDVGHHFWKRFITWHGSQNLFASNRVRARPAADIDRHCVDKLPVNFRLKPTKTNIRRFMVPAASRTTRPMNREWTPSRTHFFMQRLGKRHRTALRFNKSQIAIIGADASNQPAHKGRRARRELLEQSFLQELRHSLAWDIGNNCILPGSQANLAAAIDVRETR